MNPIDPSGTVAYLAHVIKERRLHLRIELGELAHRVGCRSAHLRDIEDALVGPDFVTMARLCATLQLDIRPVALSVVCLTERELG